MNYGLEYAQYQRDRAEPPDIFVKPQSQKFYRKKVKRKTDGFLQDKKRQKWFQNPDEDSLPHKHCGGFAKASLYK